MKMLALILAATLSACSVAKVSLNRGPASTAASSIPNLEAFKGWKEKESYVSTEIRPDSVPKTHLACGDRKLYPTHPQQTLKTYHVFETGTYDRSRLRAEDPACRIGQKSLNSRGFRPCLLADTMEHAIISDTYADSCGNYYRGFWEVTFLHADENMGTLFSLGRTLYQDPKSEFDKDMIVGQTYPVDAGEFLFLSPLFPGDEKEIEKNRATALRYTHSFDRKTLIFEPR